MERYWMAKKALLNIPVIEGALPPDTFTQVVLYADAQRALDAEREKVKRLSTCGTDHSTPWWQVKCEDLEAQLATLQAQLRQVEGERADWKKAADDEPSAIYLGQLKAAKAALTPQGGKGGGRVIKFDDIDVGDKVKVVGMGAPGFAALGDTLEITRVLKDRVYAKREDGNEAFFALTCGASRLEKVPQ